MTWTKIRKKKRCKNWSHFTSGNFSSDFNLANLCTMKQKRKTSPMRLSESVDLGAKSRWQEHWQSDVSTTNGKGQRTNHLFSLLLSHNEELERGKIGLGGKGVKRRKKKKNFFCVLRVDGSSCFRSYLKEGENDVLENNVGLKNLQLSVLCSNLAEAT